MTDENVVYRNELLIRFDQLEDGTIQWYVIPDERLHRARAASLFELAESGAPLSAMGIRTLWKLCEDGLLYSSLDLANAVRKGLAARGLREGPVVLEQLPEGATLN